MDKLIGDLKPCPFCGSDAISRLSVNEIFCDDVHDCCASIIGETPEKAIAAWNRRSDG